MAQICLWWQSRFVKYALWCLLQTLVLNAFGTANHRVYRLVDSLTCHDSSHEALVDTLASDEIADGIFTRLLAVRRYTFCSCNIYV